MTKLYNPEVQGADAFVRKSTASMTSDLHHRQYRARRALNQATMTLVYELSGITFGHDLGHP